MLRWTFLFLLLLNLGVALWGWSRERPLEAPLPPLPDSPEEIRLLSELTRTSGPAAEQDSRAKPAAGAAWTADKAASASSTDEARMGSTPALPVPPHPGESIKAD